MTIDVSMPCPVEGCNGMVKVTFEPSSPGSSTTVCCVSAATAKTAICNASTAHKSIIQAQTEVNFSVRQLFNRVANISLSPLLLTMQVSLAPASE